MRAFDILSIEVLLLYAPFYTSMQIFVNQTSTSIMELGQHRLPCQPIKLETVTYLNYITISYFFKKNRLIFHYIF